MSGRVGSIGKVAVLGAGRWGTAMAIYLSRKGLKVTLQCHLQEEYEQLVETGFAPNLPEFQCEGEFHFTMDLNRAVEEAQLIVVAIPVAFLRSVLEKIKTIPSGAYIVSINKGIERESLQTVPTIIKSFFPHHLIAHLGGPCFPEGLLSTRTPAAETLACRDESAGRRLQELFSSESFRVYRSRDLEGVATLGALKNVYAILAGMTVGYGMQEEVISVLVTRGLSEMKRYCQKRNISLDTLYGLSGLGDLALTCYSPKSSHNKNFGKRLGCGESAERILSSMRGTIAEGYYTARAVWEIAGKYEIDLPLSGIAYRILYEKMSIRDGLTVLMRRPLKVED